MSQTILHNASNQIHGIAKNLFKKLDQKLRVKTFIIKLKSDVNAIRISIEPKTLNKDFTKIFSTNIRNHLKECEETQNVDHLHHLICEELNKFDIENNFSTFVYQPIIYKKYLYFIVVQLNKAREKTHYQVQMEKINDNYRLFTSLVDASIEKFFRDSSILLINSLSRSESHVIADENEDEIIRWAGEAFTQSIIYNSIDTESSKIKEQSFRELKNFHEDCNIISSMMYEGNIPNGKITVVPHPHPNINEELVLKTPVLLSNHRAIRKLLETLAENTYLLYRAGFIYAIGSMIKSYESGAERLFTITFLKHSTWSLAHGNNIIMTVEYGMPKLIYKKVDNDKIFKQIEKAFPKVTDVEIGRLLQLINKSTLQTNGTILIIASNADKESERLKNQSILFEPFLLSPERLLQLTNIDGAVLLSPPGICFAIGAILDGTATEKGNRSRGARYNSAVRYIEQRKRPAIAIVVSEDGMVDIISNVD
ncbi:MAG: hypothetical protein GY754_22040 [bacterium]|nr:hypothetical protein [bacterium]